MENNAYSAQQAARPEYLIVSQWLQAFRVVVSDFAKQELMACIRREIEQAERRAEAMRGEVLSLRRYRCQQDCLYTMGDVADISGSHCPLDNPCTRCQLELAEAREQAMREDAERYRWLRAERASYLDGKPFIAIAHVGGSGFSAWTEEHADREIDAARKEKP